MLSETLAKGASHNAIAERLRALHLKKKMGRVELRRDTGLSGTERSEVEYTELFPTLGAESSSHSHLGYYCGLRAPLAVRIRRGVLRRTGFQPALQHDEKSAQARPLPESSSTIRSSGKG